MTTSLQENFHSLFLSNSASSPSVSIDVVASYNEDSSAGIPSISPRLVELHSEDSERNPAYDELLERHRARQEYRKLKKDKKTPPEASSPSPPIQEPLAGTEKASTRISKRHVSDYTETLTLSKALGDSEVELSRKTKGKGINLRLKGEFNEMLPSNIKLRSSMHRTASSHDREKSHLMFDLISENSTSSLKLTRRSPMERSASLYDRESSLFTNFELFSALPSTGRFSRSKTAPLSADHVSSHLPKQYPDPDIDNDNIDLESLVNKEDFDPLLMKEYIFQNAQSAEKSTLQVNIRAALGEDYDLMFVQESTDVQDSKHVQDPLSRDTKRNAENEKKFSRANKLLTLTRDNSDKSSKRKSTAKLPSDNSEKSSHASSEKSSRRKSTKRLSTLSRDDSEKLSRGASEKSSWRKSATRLSSDNSEQLFSRRKNSPNRLSLPLGNADKKKIKANLENPREAESSSPFLRPRAKSPRGFRSDVGTGEDSKVSSKKPPRINTLFGRSSSVR